MGEAKRRSQLDKNWGKPEEFSLEFLDEDIISELDYLNTLLQELKLKLKSYTWVCLKFSSGELIGFVEMEIGSKNVGILPYWILKDDKKDKHLVRLAKKNNREICRLIKQHLDSKLVEIK